MADVIALRREFHRHPELGYTEFRTAARVIELLRSWGYEVRFGAEAMDPEARQRVPSQAVMDASFARAVEAGVDPALLEAMRGGLTAVVATRRGGDGPTVGFRFDMDALPVEESPDVVHLPVREGFVSSVPGVMHACGHDGHTAIGLALAERLATGELGGTVKFFFQPAEEGGAGARAMAARGVADDVDRLFCMHLGCELPLGMVAAGTVGFLANRGLEARFTGVPAHAAAAPEQGRHALLAAASALMNIHALPRFSTGTTRVNVGLLEGGTTTNIIPHRARMLIEVRAETGPEAEDLEHRVRRILEGAATMQGVEQETKVIGWVPSLTNDAAAMALVREEAEASGMFTEVRDTHPAGASEDAGFLMERVQQRGGEATYMIMGTTLAAPHHHFAFDIDEESLPSAVDLLERVGRRAAGARRPAWPA